MQFCRIGSAIVLAMFIAAGSTLPLRAQSETQTLVPAVDSGSQKWGYRVSKGIGDIGEFHIKPQFDLAGPFVGDRAVIKVKDRFGYINRDGIVVISPQFLAADRFSSEKNPIAAVKDEKTKRWGFITPDGTFGILPRYEAVGRFSPSAHLAWIKEGGKCGYVDPSGKEVIEPKFAMAGIFSNGVAPVKIDNAWGYIDQAGKVVQPFDFVTAQPAASGIVGVRERSGDFHYLSTTTWKPLSISSSVRGGSRFLGDMAVVKNEAGRCALLHRNGKELTDFEFTRLDIVSANSARGVVESAPGGEVKTVTLTKDGNKTEITSQNSSMVKVKIISNLKPAKIFRIPLYDYEGTDSEDSLLNDDTRAEMDTDCEIQLDSLIAYELVLVFQDRRERRTCHPATQRTVQVNFP